MSRWATLSANEQSALEGVFWSHGPSRDALAERLGYSKTRSNAVVAGLIEQGWLDEVGARASSGGRRAETLQLHRGLGVLLCADLGATSVEVAVLTPDLQVLARHAEAIDVRDGPGRVLSRMRTLMRELLARATIKPGAVETVSVSATRYSPGAPGNGQTWTNSYAAAPGEPEPGLLQRAAAGTDAQIEEAWKAANVIDFSQAGTFAVNVPVTDLQSLAAVNTRLAGISAIQRTDLVSLNRQMAHILIHYVGDPSQLRVALAQSNLELSGDPSSLVLIYHGDATNP